MTLNRNKLYSILFLACLAGYFWLYINLTSHTLQNKSFEFCLIKHTAKIPCPSCGSTRSVISITKGNYLEALIINPLGYIVASIMLLTPFWITLDIGLKKNTLFKFYKNIEIQLKKPLNIIPIILIIIMNWIWNITKEL